MRALAFVALAGCRQVLGIPSGGTSLEDGFAIHANVSGAQGASGGAIVTLNGQRETLADDTDFQFSRKLVDGQSYDIKPVSGNCTIQNGTGTVDGGDVSGVTITCDGFSALGDWGFTAPIEPQLGTADSGMVIGSILTQQTYLAPQQLHSEATISSVIVGGTQQTLGAMRYGPFPFAATLPFEVDISRPPFPLRMFAATPMVSAPGVFGYGKPDAPATSESFGTAVSASNDVLVVGAPEVGGGRAIVFRRAGRSWSQEAVLASSSAVAGDRFGASVAISGSTLVVGAPATTSRPGAAYVFTYAAGAWQPGATLQATTPHAGDAFGTAVAIGTTHIVVGAPGDACASGGCVFEFPQPSGAAVGLLGTGHAGDRFGASVAVSGTTLVVGAPGDDASGTVDPYPDAGAAYVYALGAQTSTAYLKADVPGAGDQFGAAVAIDGAYIVIGAPLEDGNGIDGPDDNSRSGAGAAYLFHRTSTWSQVQYIKAPNADTGDNFGRSVAILSNTLAGTTTCVVAIGAPFEDSGLAGGADPMHDETAPDAGAVFAYRLDVASSTLDTPAYLKASNIDAGDAFGSALGLTAEMLVVGAPLEDAASTGWNQPANEDLLDAGAVYAFR